MRSLRFVALATFALVFARPTVGAQQTALRDAKCVLIRDSKIALLPPMQTGGIFVDGAVCPALVEFKARVHLNVYPEYPSDLADAKVGGDVLVQFSFGGQVDTSSVIVLQSADLRFSNAVRAAMLAWTGEPALVGSRALPQWVAIDVRFKPEGCGLNTNPPVIEATGFLCIAPKGVR